MAEAEADGLKMLASFGARTPEVVGILCGSEDSEDEDRKDSHRSIKKSSGSKDDVIFLAMQFIEHRAVDLHRAKMDILRSLKKLYSSRGEYFGYSKLNFTGTIAQQNHPHAVFEEFWWEDRLKPLLGLCHSKGRLHRVTVTSLEKMLHDSVNKLQLSAERPTPVHGDLWSGNVLFSGNEAYLIDPSVAFSLPEQDFAMLELFGSPLTMKDYQELRDIPVDLLQRRMIFFQLYPLMVHVALFGGSYELQTLQLLERIQFM